MGFVIPEKANGSIEEGVWVEYQESQFLVAHAGGVNFQRELMRLKKPYRRQEERSGSLDPALVKRLTVEAMSTTILLGWKGVISGGKEVEYSEELAHQALKNDDAFRQFIMEFSLDLENFREENKEIEGNS